MTVLVSIALLCPPIQAGSAPSDVIAQIIEPNPGFKLRAGQKTAVRIRVTATDAAQLNWSLGLRLQGASDQMYLASGMVPVDNEIVTDLAADCFEVGRQYVLALTVTTPIESTTTQASFSVPDLQYSLVSWEEGNLSRRTYPIAGGDASGGIFFFSDRVAEPTKLIVLDRRTGRREQVVANSFSTYGIKLSPDGTRLFFSGEAPDRDGMDQLGIGFVSLGDKTARAVGPGGDPYFSIDSTGRRVVYEHLRQDYVFFDEATGERRVLTTDPSAISYYAPCPGITASTPLITADGSTIVIITGATLGLVPADDTIGCRIFSYDVATATFSLVASLPRGVKLDRSTLSFDGHWLSFVSTRRLANGTLWSFPGLLDLQTAALRDPVIDLGGYITYDCVVTGDGQGLVISTQADLDPRVGNADHNMELFYYDLASGAVTQITETTGGIGLHSGACAAYEPYVSQDAGLLGFGQYRITVEPCYVDGPQRNGADGFSYRGVRAVRKRPGNHGPVFEKPDDRQVLAGQSVTLSFTATDADGDPISFFAQEKGGLDVFPGSEITDHYDGTATFTWRTRPEHVGTHVLRVAAFDEGGGEVFHDVVLDVVAGDRTPTPTVTSTPVPSGAPSPARSCVGDCDRNGRVTVSEVITGLDIALGRLTPDACPSADCHGGGPMAIDCLTRAVDAMLHGCSE